MNKSNLDEPTFSFQDEPTYMNNLQQHLTDEEILQLLALRELNYTLQNNAKSPQNLSSISFKGVKNTKKETLEEIFKPAFKSKTLEEILTNMTNSCGKLEAHDMVKSFDISFKPNGVAKDGIKAELEVKEVPKFTVKTGTEFGEGESSLDSSIAIRNIFGRGEKLEGSAKFGTLTRHNYQLNYFNPLNLHKPDQLLHLFAFDSTTDYQLNAGHDLISRGFGAALKANSGFGFHELSFGSTWRTVTRMGFQSPPSIRKEAGDSILTSIKHTHTVGKLDNPVLPNEGYKLKLFQEISGLNSSSKFIKTKLEGLVAKRLTNSISVNLNTQSGLLLTLDGKPSLLADRFHLGGPTSVRGFRTWGLGQHDRGSSIGGDMYWSLGLSMFGKLPILNFENLKWHTFANLGKSVKFNQDSSSISQVKSHLTSSSFYKQHSSSAGIGLVYQLQNVRLEANYTLPLSINQRDQVRKGFQLGLGIEFL